MLTIMVVSLLVLFPDRKAPDGTLLTMALV